MEYTSAEARALMDLIMGPVENFGVFVSFYFHNNFAYELRYTSIVAPDRITSVWFVMDIMTERLVGVIVQRPGGQYSLRHYSGDTITSEELDYGHDGTMTVMLRELLNFHEFWRSNNNA